ncbi:MAG: YIP1 family protein [Nitrosopumilus sp.]
MERSKLELCKYCDSGRITKKGIRKNKSGGVQIFKCLDCKKKFPSNVAFEKISQNTQYFQLSVILFGIACFISFFTEISALLFQMPYGIREIPNLVFHVINFSGIVLNNFLMILFTFYIGRKLDGNTSFRQIFTSMSFCLIPIIIGAIILASRTFLYFFSIPSYDTSFHHMHQLSCCPHQCCVILP